MAAALLDAQGRRKAIERLAGDRAAQYQQLVLLPMLCRLTFAGSPSHEDVLDALESPYLALRAIFGYYAFARRGPRGEDFVQTAVQALDAQIGNDKVLESQLAQIPSPTVWDAALAICLQRNIKPNEQVNRYMLDGFLALSQEASREDGSSNLFHLVRDTVLRGGRLVTVFERLTDIRSVGPKSASLILRDVVWLYGLERSVHPAERILLQPVDGWLRRVADYLTDELTSETTADWVIAGKMAKVARLSGVSGIDLNMGIQYFGWHEVRHAQVLPRAIQELIS